MLEGNKRDWEVEAVVHLLLLVVVGDHLSWLSSQYVTSLVQRIAVCASALARTVFLMPAPNPSSERKPLGGRQIWWKFTCWLGVCTASLSLFTVWVQGGAQSAGSSFVSVEVGNCAPNVGFVSLVRQKKPQPTKRSHQVCFSCASFNSYAAPVPKVLVRGLLVHMWAGTYAASCFNAVPEPPLYMLMH